jgi:hypothetical protein
MRVINFPLNVMDIEREMGLCRKGSLRYESLNVNYENRSDQLLIDALFTNILRKKKELQSMLMQS